MMCIMINSLYHDKFEPNLNFKVIKGAENTKKTRDVVFYTFLVINKISKVLKWMQSFRQGINPFSEKLVFPLVLG